MADSAGIKISQPHYDATKAGDINLIFSSSWPNLLIVKDVTFTLVPILSGGFYSYPSQTITHNLGYLFSLAWTNGSALIADTSSSTGPLPPSLTVRDAKSLYISNGSVTFSPTLYNNVTSPPILTVNVKLFNVDITTVADYPFVKSPTSGTTPYNPDVGIKIVKQGKSITSNDMRDFILHSRCQSPAILSVKTGTTTVTYTNPENYIPWVFGYGYDNVNSRYSWAYLSGQATPYLLIDTTHNSYTVTGTGGLAVSIVVLRDPLFASTNINASY